MLTAAEAKSKSIDAMNQAMEARRELIESALNTIERYVNKAIERRQQWTWIPFKVNVTVAQFNPDGDQFLAWVGRCQVLEMFRGTAILTPEGEQLMDALTNDYKFTVDKGVGGFGLSWDKV